MTKKLTVYRSGRIVKIKAGLTEADLRASGYFDRHPDTVVCKGSEPSIRTAENWISRGVAKAIDGCTGVEPDGYCSHGLPSWLLAAGLI